MKKEKIIVLIVGIIVLVALMVGIIYHFRSRTTYALRIPELGKLQSITLKQNKKQKDITNQEEVQTMLDHINGTKRITTNESIQDAPVNVKDEIMINFNFEEGGVSTIFVYQKNNQYYIEQPYNGIYEISEEEYQKIEKEMK